jgi:hypothetical protein
MLGPAVLTASTKLSMPNGRFAYAHLLDIYLPPLMTTFPRTLTTTPFECSSIEALCGLRLLADHGGPTDYCSSEPFPVDLHLQCGTENPKKDFVSSFVSPPASLAGIGYRIHGRFIKLVPVRVWVEDPKEVSSDPRNYHLLRDPISNCGHS